MKIIGINGWYLVENIFGSKAPCSSVIILTLQMKRKVVSSNKKNDEIGEKCRELSMSFRVTRWQGRTVKFWTFNVRQGILDLRSSWGWVSRPRTAENFNGEKMRVELQHFLLWALFQEISYWRSLAQCGITCDHAVWPHRGRCHLSLFKGSYLAFGTQEMVRKCFFLNAYIFLFALITLCMQKKCHWNGSKLQNSYPHGMNE